MSLLKEMFDSEINLSVNKMSNAEVEKCRFHGFDGRGKKSICSNEFCNNMV